MSFRDFTLTEVQDLFDLATDERTPLFRDVAPVAISPGLAAFWAARLAPGLLLTSEKGRSEFVTAPLLSEVWGAGNGEISLLSGLEFNVDPAKGLNGTPDFLLCRSRRVTVVSAPVLTAVEAKRDSIPGGYGQCVAEMVAAQLFNAKAGKPVDPVYGCVTTGAVWKFMSLSGTSLSIDADEYSIAQPDKILGILLHCCGVSPAP